MPDPLGRRKQRSLEGPTRSGSTTVEIASNSIRIDLQEIRDSSADACACIFVSMGVFLRVCLAVFASEVCRREFQVIVIEVACETVSRL